LAVIAIAFFALPLIGLLWRAPWGDVGSYLTDEATLTALRLSMICSLLATLLSVVLGVPLAWLLARVDFPGRSAVRALCTLSMVLPPVVAGVALFLALGRRGLVDGRRLGELASGRRFPLLPVHPDPGAQDRRQHQPHTAEDRPPPERRQPAQKLPEAAHRVSRTVSAGIQPSRPSATRILIQ